MTATEDVTSTGPPMRPWTATTVRGALLAAERDLGADHVAFRFLADSSTWTMGRLRREADAFGRSLVAHDVAAGERIAVWSPGRSVWPLALVGAAGVGVAVCGLNTRYRSDELVHVLDALRPRLVFVATEFLDIDAVTLVRTAMHAAGLVADDADADRLVVTCPPDGRGELEAFLRARDGVPDSRWEARVAAVEPADDCLIQFTSGSTGRPKGVLVSHDAALRSAHHTCEGMRLVAGDVLYSALPYFHIGGSICSGLAALTSGATVVTPETMRAAEALDTIEGLGCTAFHGHGALWNILLAEQRRRPRDLRTLRKGWASGDEPFLRSLHDELGVDRLVVLYGSSEAGAIASSVPEDPLATRLTTLGRPVPGVRVSIREPGTGAPSAPGEAGELWVAGPSIMTRYLHEPPEPAAAGERWVPTGDLIASDEAGYLRYLGRTDDRLKPGGENVSVVEVERFIAEDERVSRVVVVGIPDERLGEAPAAAVEVAEGEELTPADVVTRCRAAIAGFKVPRHVLIVDRFPVLDTGKIDRRALRADVLRDARRQAGGGS